jgi:hypothetical protein
MIRTNKLILYGIDKENNLLDLNIYFRVMTNIKDDF